MIIKRSRLLIAVATWFALFLALSFENYNSFQLLNIIGFISLAILPGFLTIIAGKIRGLPFWGYMTLAIGFSLLELIVMALIGNTLLPLAGISRPLDKPVLLLELYSLIGILVALAWIRMKDIEIRIKKYILFDTFRDLALSFTPIFFLALSIFGAIRLNNGGSNILTMIMLGTMGIYIGILTYYSKECDENTLPTAIFFMALSLLLMTSLRGWFVTGHDIQQETQFFELAKINGFWSVATSSDAYNACLSITILPTIFANLLNVADQYIFKFFFQIFFALCPVLVYLIGRQWTGRRISLLGAIYFMAFPTFFTDMPFIVRQEIAFVFFGLMLYLIFEPALTLRIRRILFTMMGIGVVLSHYSTTYTVLVIFGLVVISTPLLVKLFKILKLPAVGASSGKSKINILMVGFLLLFSFLWTSTITHTGGELSLVVDQTIGAIRDGFAGDNRSIDAMSLLSFTKVDPTADLNNYIQTTVQQTRAGTPSGTYFDQSIYSQYPIVISYGQTLPLSSFGQFLDNSGISFSGLSSLLGTLLGKLMEILAPLGLIYIIFKNYLRDKIDVQLYWIAFYSLVFVAANIFLPVLSAQYGVFRAMQQSLFVLGFFIVMGSDAIGRFFVKRSGSAEIFSLLVLMLFFFYSTTFIPQLIGGNTPDLHLNNTGTYYDNYLTKGTEVNAEHWLVENIPNASSSIDPSQFPDGIDLLDLSGFQSIKTFQSLDGSNPSNDILPALVKRDSYVFLGEGTIKDGQAAFDFNGNIVSYLYPIDFLGNNKNLIYNNGGSEIYR
jgi:uncharacterized membrane protein